MKLKLLAGTAVAMACIGLGASAQDTGWYGAIDAGAHHAPTLAVGVAPQPLGFNDNGGLEFKTDNVDWTVLARVGYRLSPNLRVEIEGGYRHSGLKSVFANPNTQAADLALCGLNSAPGACDSPDGSINAWTGMANLIFDIAPHSRIDPFIGGGVGALHVKVRADGELVSNDYGTSVHGNIDDSSTKFGYQAIGGLAFRASDRLNIDLTYHYLTGSRINFLAVDQTDQASTVMSGRYQDHAVTLGLRYSFAAAASTTATAAATAASAASSAAATPTAATRRPRRRSPSKRATTWSTSPSTNM